jgi:hypothetical protein
MVDGTYTFIAYDGPKEELEAALLIVECLERHFWLHISTSRGYVCDRNCYHWLFDRRRALKYSELMETICRMPHFKPAADCSACRRMQMIHVA